jgi:hypothetical protein
MSNNPPIGVIQGWIHVAANWMGPDKDAVANSAPGVEVAASP